jgi:hypothetical protein
MNPARVDPPVNIQVLPRRRPRMASEFSSLDVKR